MKIKMLALCSLCSLWLIGPGCATGKVSPQTAAFGARIAAREAARLIVRKDGNAVSYLVAAREVLNSAIDKGIYDPAALKLALEANKDLSNPRVLDGFRDVIELYRLQWGEALDKKLDASATARPVLIGIRDGLNEGLMFQ